MNITLNAVLIIAAVILFVLAGLGVSAPRAHLGWFGMACLAIALFLV